MEERKVLFLASNPTDTTQSNLLNEQKGIEAGLEQSTYRDAFDFDHVWATTPKEMHLNILKKSPQIVHFSGHGISEGGLVFEDEETKQASLVSAQTLSSIFKLADSVECVVLNACYSEVQAKAIARHVPYTIGMNEAITDKAAQVFAIGFYEALGAGKDIPYAFDYGCNCIYLYNAPGELTPVLIRQVDVGGMPLPTPYEQGGVGVSCKSSQQIQSNAPLSNSAALLAEAEANRILSEAGALAESTRKISRVPEKIESNSKLKKYDSLIRYANIECPEKTQLNQRFSLIVELLIDEPEDFIDSGVLSIEETGTDELPEVEVVLSCRGFELESSNTQTIQVQRVQDSSLRFTLIPRTLGQRTIKANFYQNGKPLGQSKFEVFVCENSGESSRGRVSRQSSALEFGEHLSMTPQDLELYIDLSNDERQLSFSLHSSKSEINYHRKKIGEIILRGSPLGKMKSVFKEMSQLAQRNPNTIEGQAFAKHRLETIGNELWDELIPEQLKQEYWKFRTHVKSVLITSEEPWIPWELLKPYRYTEDGEQENSKFLCQEFSLSRWLSGGGMVGSLNINYSRAVAPRNIDLPCVKEEVDFLGHLPSLNNQIVSLETLNSRMQVLDSFKNEDLSILHFACHGMFDSTSPNDSLIQLSDGELRPSDIKVKFGGKRQRPLVFINACHGSRAEFSFTGLGGWADRMLNARAGAFVGAMWEVNDKLALQFAKAFYAALLRDGETIAEAFRTAREHIRQAAPFNSTWLAYTLYADPEGRVEI